MPMPNDEYDDQVEQDAPDWFAQYLPDTQPISVAPGFTESPGGGYGAESNLDEATRTGRDTAPPSAFPGRFGDDGYDPYAISLGDKFDPRSPEGRASSLMESAIGQTRGRIESASQLNQDRVIDWNRVEIDQDERGAPVQKVYSTTGKLLGVSEPVGSFDDLRSVGGYAKDPEGNRYDLPGFDGRSRFGTPNPTTLEDGRPVYYDKANNLTFANKDNRPGDLLVGGLGYQGGRRSVEGYNVNPEVDKFGRDVWFEAGSGRTFLRGKDNSLGARVDPNAPPAPSSYQGRGRVQSTGGGKAPQKGPFVLLETEQAVYYSLPDGQVIAENKRTGKPINVTAGDVERIQREREDAQYKALYPQRPPSSPEPNPYAFAPATGMPGGRDIPPMVPAQPAPGGRNVPPPYVPEQPASRPSNYGDRPSGRPPLNTGPRGRP